MKWKKDEAMLSFHFKNTILEILLLIFTYSLIQLNFLTFFSCFKVFPLILNWIYFWDFDLAILKYDYVFI